MIDDALCPICQQRPSGWFCNPDVYSDTQIPCCRDCADFMWTANRHQFFNSASPYWYEEHKEKLSRAIDRLQLEYERLYSQ